MRSGTYRAGLVLVTALLATSATGTLSCGGDDDGGGAGGASGRSGADAGKDASSEAKGGSGGIIGTGGSSGTGGSAGTSGSAGTAGTGGTDGGAGSGGAAGGPSDGAADTTGGAAGQGGAAGTGGKAGSAGTAGSAGAAGSAGRGGTDGGADVVTPDGADGAGGIDGGGDGDVPDGGAADAVDDTVLDASIDAPESDADAAGDGDGGSLCAVDNTPCSNAGSNGLCKSQVCAACTDGPGGDAGGDDANCATAYAGAYLCLSGVCSAGDCRANGDCASNVSGPLCGISQPHFCGKCTADSQCLAASPSTPVCNTGSGVCVASAGSCNGQADNVQCSINSADVCCGSACTPGECCTGTAGDQFCKTKIANPGAVCSAGHQCTLCDAVSGLTFIVDPLSGVNAGATGSGKASGQPNAACAFKSITAALQAIGPNPAVGTIVQVRNTAPVSVAGNGETFPIDVTTNVTITASGGVVTVTPPAGQVGFSFQSAGSGINGTLGGGSMVIDGAANTAANGITATTGATTTTTLQNLTIQNFLQEGILVIAGSLTIKEGVVVTGNGTTGARRSGLHATSSGRVYVTVPAGQTMTAFNSNTQYGILVDGAGAVTITGSVSGGAGTIETRGNNTAGLTIAQTPGVGLPLNTVTGLLSVGTTAGNGIRIGAGSNVRIRSSQSLGNFNSGIIVITTVVGATRYNSLTDIDLGRPSDPGNNQFQASLGSNANIGAGICLQVDGSTGTLSAQGNLFSGNKNCATTAASLTFSNANCGSQRDLGLAVAATGGNTTGNNIDVTQCTHP